MFSLPFFTNIVVGLAEKGFNISGVTISLATIEMSYEGFSYDIWQWKKPLHFDEVPACAVLKPKPFSE